MRIIRIYSIMTIIVLLTSSCTRLVRESDLFQQNRAYLQTAEDGIQRISLEAESGVELQGLLLPARKSENVIIFCYGNASCVLFSLDYMKWLRENTGMNVVSFDYRGYGKSGGTPSLKACAEDTAKILKWANNIYKGKVHLFGQSIGTGMAVYAAAKEPADSLILLSPPDSIENVVRCWAKKLNWFIRIFVWLKPEPSLKAPELQPITYIAGITVPLLIAHGTKDEIIPITLGRNLYEHAESKNKQFVELEGFGHNDISLDIPVLGKAIREFYEEFNNIENE